jgi:hypothetical protein
MLVPSNKRVYMNNVMNSKKLQHKANVPRSNIEIIWAPIFEWYAIGFIFENKHPMDICLKRIDLLAQNMLTILGSIVNTIVG